MHVMTVGFPGLSKLRQLHPFLWVERTMVPMPRIRSEFSGLVGLTQSWAAATLGALLHRARKQDFDVVHAHLDGQIPSLSVPFARYCEAHSDITLAKTITADGLGVTQMLIRECMLQRRGQALIPRWRASAYFLHERTLSILMAPHAQCLEAIVEMTNLLVKCSTKVRWKSQKEPSDLGAEGQFTDKPNVS